MEDEVYRTCTACGETKVLNSDNFKIERVRNKSTGKLYVYYRKKCKKCLNSDMVRYNAKYAKNHPEKVRECRRRYENKEDVKKRKRAYHAKYMVKYAKDHPEKIREWKRRRTKRDVDNLNDRYIKRLLVKKYKGKYKYRDINDSKMIAIQRAKVKVHRNYKWSDSYIRSCINSAIVNAGYKPVSPDNISKRDLARYRKYLYITRLKRELEKLTF